MKYYFGKTELDFSDFNYTLSGFSKRDSSQLTIGISKLLLKILWIEDDNKPLIFISLDILYISKELSTKVYEYLEDKYNIEKSNIIFNATHTHSAPGIEKKFDRFIDDKVIDYIFERICLICDNRNFKSGQISFKTFKSETKMWISRRKFGRNIKKLFLEKSMLMLPNEETEIDDGIRLLSIINEEKEIDVLVYNFSCHPVFNRNNEISSDFIGKISQQLENNDIKDSMFLQGFLGDLRPNFISKDINEANIIDKLKILANKKIFKKYDQKDFELFCKNISSEILNNLPLKVVDDSILNSEFKYEIQSQCKKININFSVKVVLIDKNIFISIPAEANTKYYVKLSNRFDNFNIIPMGLSDDIIGYLPFYNEVNEGGYEVNSIVNYGVDTPLSESSLKNFYFYLIDDIKRMIGKN